MKKIGLSLLLLFSLFNGKLFAEGIKFENLTFEEALNKAKETDKLIFIDFYTEWCGPCKKLAAGPFTYPEVGAYYNAQFINLTYDAEKEGLEVAKKYKVSSYPTLMFIDGDGQMIYKGGGASHGNDLVGFGKAAIKSMTDEYSLEKLQALFPQKQNDEEFLKLYYHKMKEYGVSPTEGMEAWLKVQTEIPEESAEMMEFLIKNQYQFFLGGKAEEILNTYGTEYKAMASEYQKKMLNRMPGVIKNHTKVTAYKTKNSTLLYNYIACIENDTTKNHFSIDINSMKLDYLLLSNDYSTFKTQAVVYVDSIRDAVNVKQMKKEDKVDYERYTKNNSKDTSAFRLKMIQFYKNGRQASGVVDDIVKTGHKYLQYAETPAEFKHIKSWVDYCYKLIPGDYSVDNLYANLLYREGQTERAIQLKEEAIAEMPSTEKKKVNVEYDLSMMQQGKALMQVPLDGK